MIIGIKKIVKREEKIEYLKWREHLNKKLKPFVAVNNNKKLIKLKVQILC